MSFGELLFFGSLVGLANVVGGLLLARPGIFQQSRQFLGYLVALGAGFMLAAIFIEVMPEVFVLWTNGTANGAQAGRGVLGAIALILGGYLLIHFFEHTIAPHFHFGEETHPEAVVRPSAAYTALGGLSIQPFFYGTLVGLAFMGSPEVVVL